MEIRFCDLCDASISEADVEGGAARRSRGRWHCAPCRSAGTRRRVVTALLVPLALLAAAGVGALVAVKVLEPRTRQVEADVVTLKKALAEAGREDPDLTELLATLARTDDELHRALRLLDTAHAERAEGVNEALAALGDQLTALEDSVTEVREYIVERDAPPAEPDLDTATDPETPPPPELGIDDWLPHLTDTDSGVRLSALVALEKFEDPRVTAAARTALSDSDSVVRAQAATMLGIRGDPGAIPGLIDLLTDTNLLVRTVAHRSLEQIAGVALPYHPADPVTDREAAAKRIREALVH